MDNASAINPRNRQYLSQNVPDIDKKRVFSLISRDLWPIMRDFTLNYSITHLKVENTPRMGN